MLAKCAKKFTQKRVLPELTQHCKKYFSQRKATLATNNITIETAVSKGLHKKPA
jgi:hypothetical protein